MTRDNMHRQRRNNEMGVQLLNALGFDPSDWSELTFTSKVGEPERITLTGYAYEAATGETLTVTQTWQPIDTPAEDA